MTSASDDKACVSKFNQVETDIQVYINANMMHLQDHAYDAGYEAGQAAALRSPAPAATVTAVVAEVSEELQGVIDSARNVVDCGAGGCVHCIRALKLALALHDVAAVRGAGGEGV